MYAVVAHHNTGHGEAASFVLWTMDPLHALETARNIESLGYEFYRNYTGAIVYRVEPETIYPKWEGTAVFAYTFSSFDDEGKPGTRKWSEDWISEDFGVECIKAEESRARL